MYFLLVRLILILCGPGWTQMMLIQKSSSPLLSLLVSSSKYNVLVSDCVYRKCDVTARCVNESVRSVCGDDAADWLTELLNHVRAPYVTCWRCGHSEHGKHLLSSVASIHIHTQLNIVQQWPETGPVVKISRHI